jgi:hypothetical protein
VSPSPGRAPPRGVGVRVLVMLGAIVGGQAGSSPGDSSPDPLCNKQHPLLANDNDQYGTRSTKHVLWGGE